MTSSEDGVPYIYRTYTARCYRDSRYQNIWLVGAGVALALSGELFASYVDLPLVVGTHDQMLKCLLFQSGLDFTDLVRA